MDQAAWIAADRFAAWAASLAVCVTALAVARNRWRRSGTIAEREFLPALGLGIAALGMSVHQAYFWVWQIAIAAGGCRNGAQWGGAYCDLATALADGTMILHAAYAAWVIGSALIMAFWTPIIWPRAWPYVTAAIVAGLWGLGFIIAIGAAG